MKTYDLEYFSTGFSTRFVPVTDAGRDAWNTIADEHGVAAVLNHHAPSVLRQLRRAGYSVGKAKPVTDDELNDILDELETLEETK